MKYKLNDLLTQVKNSEYFEHPECEKFVTVSGQGKGVSRRIITDGKTPVPFSGYRIKSGQLIYSRIGASDGAFGIVPDFLDNAAVSKDFPVFSINEEKIIKRYLLLFLYSQEFKKQANKKSFGATLKRLKEESFLNFEIDIPDLKTQQAKIEKINRVLNLKTRLNKELSALDDLVKARFVEMFGDPVVHLDKGETVQLEKIAEKITVGFVGEASNDYVSEGVPYLRTQNVRVNHIDLNGLIYVTESFHKKNPKSIIHPGDVLISRVGANRGMAAMVPKSLPEANIANCLIVGQTENINPYYLAFYLNMSYGRHPQFGASVGSAQGVVNTSILKKWEVYLPNRKQQDNFYEFAKQLDKSKFVLQKSLEKTQLLFDSLMQEYFG